MAPQRLRRQAGLEHGQGISRATQLSMWSIVPRQAGRASRPTSAVEKSRSIPVREGGAMLRPASAGEESATSRSSVSEASQQGAVQRQTTGGPA